MCLCFNAWLYVCLCVSVSLHDYVLVCVPLHSIYSQMLLWKVLLNEKIKFKNCLNYPLFSSICIGSLWPSFQECMDCGCTSTSFDVLILPYPFPQPHWPGNNILTCRKTQYFLWTIQNKFNKHDWMKCSKNWIHSEPKVLGTRVKSKNTENAFYKHWYMKHPVKTNLC